MNVPLKLSQRSFITAVILPLAFLGFVVLLVGRERRWSVGVLLIIPLYYASVQALIHTEYRYVLAIPHVLMIFVAVTGSAVIGRLSAFRH